MASMVAVSKIRIPSNVRTFHGAEIADLASAPLSDFPKDFQDGIKSLADNIKQIGLLNPITVKDLGGGERYRLIAGFRRFKAVQYLGKTQIDVKSVKGKSKDEIIAQLAENIHRENLNAMDIANSLEKIREIKGISKQADLAKILNKSQTWVSHYLSLLRADESIQDAIRTGEMGAVAAKQLISLPKDEQKSALHDALHDENVPQKHKSKTKAKVTVRKAKIQADKRKMEAERRQVKIRPLAEREREQRKNIIMEYCSKKGVERDADIKLLDDFWKYLHSMGRIMIERD